MPQLSTMADDNSKKREQSTPPPMDPFPTYQTHYPRSSKHDEENPFIQFRRFADDQFSAFFSGFNNLLGLSAPASSGGWKREVEDIMRQREEWEEGFRKQFEQEMEEMRQTLDKAKTDAWKSMEESWKQAAEQQKTQIPEDASGWWTKGNAAKCPALNAQEPSKNVKTCPALYDDQGQPKTELDAYEALPSKNKDKHVQVFQAPLTQRPANTWWSALGHDGKQKQRHIEEDPPASMAESYPKPRTYSLWSARRMSPFENPDQTIPWLMLSPYSPVYLCNPSQPRLYKVKIQDNEGASFQISSPRFVDRWYTTTDEKMATHKPWADAFEDLLSLTQTGKMVERDNWHTWRTPRTWIHDMASRGSLGQMWGFDNAGLLVKKPVVARDMVQAPKQATWEHALQDGHEGSVILKQADNERSEYERPQQDSETIIETEPISRQSYHNENPTLSSSAKTVPIQSSQLVTTVSQMLADGSLETKRSTRTRFTDGSEQSHEEIEVNRSPLPTDRLEADQTFTTVTTNIAAPSDTTVDELKSRVRKETKQLIDEVMSLFPGVSLGNVKAAVEEQAQRAIEAAKQRETNSDAANKTVTTSVSHELPISAVPDANTNGEQSVTGNAHFWTKTSNTTEPLTDPHVELRRRDIARRQSATHEIETTIDQPESRTPSPRPHIQYPDSTFSTTETTDRFPEPDDPSIQEFSDQIQLLEHQIRQRVLRQHERNLYGEFEDLQKRTFARDGQPLPMTPGQMAANKQRLSQLWQELAQHAENMAEVERRLMAEDMQRASNVMLKNKPHRKGCEYFNASDKQDLTPATTSYSMSEPDTETAHNAESGDLKETSPVEIEPFTQPGRMTRAIQDVNETRRAQVQAPLDNVARQAHEQKEKGKKELEMDIENEKEKDKPKRRRGGGWFWNDS
jgi:hypothetical protein